MRTSQWSKLGVGSLAAAYFATTAPAHSETLEAQNFQERLNPSVDVSGGTRAGVMAGPYRGPSRLQVLHFVLPKPTDRVLCIQISSNSGLYEALLQVPLKGRPAGPHSVRFGSRHADLPSARKELVFAALGTIRKACNSEIEGVLPLSWSDRFDKRRFVVLVNSSRLRTDIVVPLKSGGAKVFPCRDLAVDQRVVFDKTCTVDLPADARPEGSFIRRSRSFNTMSPVPLPVWR